LKQDPRLTIVGGHYGVGKSECAIAIALYRRRHGAEVTLVDLDVVNPYFRSREARAILEEHGVTVIGNSLGIDTGVDLPAIPGTVVPALRDHTRRVVVDLGGDPVGARALRQFLPHISPEDTEFLYVVNAFRPENRDASAALASLRAIEGAVGLAVTGLVNNSHLLHETTCRHLRKGQELCLSIERHSGVPVVYTTARTEVLEACSTKAMDLAGIPVELVGALRQDWMNSGNGHSPSHPRR
jgi:hypothetical protein